MEESSATSLLLGLLRILAAGRQQPGVASVQHHGVAFGLVERLEQPELIQRGVVLQQPGRVGQVAQGGLLAAGALQRRQALLAGLQHLGEQLLELAGQHNVAHVDRDQRQPDRGHRRPGQLGQPPVEGGPNLQQLVDGRRANHLSHGDLEGGVQRLLVALVVGQRGFGVGDPELGGDADLERGLVAAQHLLAGQGQRLDAQVGLDDLLAIADPAVLAGRRDPAQLALDVAQALLVLVDRDRARAALDEHPGRHAGQQQQNDGRRDGIHIHVSLSVNDGVARGAPAGALRSQSRLAACPGGPGGAIIRVGDRTRRAAKRA